MSGRPIKANQEMVLRKLWADEKERNRLMVEVVPVHGSIAPETKTKGGMKRGQTSKGLDKLLFKGVDAEPKDFLGKDEFEQKVLKTVCVRWVGDDEYTPGCGALWYSAKSLGIEEADGQENEEEGGSMVAISSFLWVLDPERLCEAVTGVKWVQFKDRMDEPNEEGKAATARFLDHQQLAQFLEGQIKMFGRMVR